jgi:hypothetical protein
MSDEAPQSETYTADATGLREAAAAVTARRGGAEDGSAAQVPPTLIDGDERTADQPIKVREAAENLARYRAGISEQRAALDRAMGVATTEQEATTKAAVAEALDQPAPVPQDPAEQDRILQNAHQAQQQAHAEIQQAWAAHQQYAAAIQNSLKYVEHAFAREFPEIQTAEDFARLQVHDPARFEQAREAIMHNRDVIHESIRVQQATQQYQQAVEQQWALQQDQVFTQRHPELRDPKVAREVGDMVMRELTEAYGLTMDDLGQMWHGGKQISLRSAAAQEILLDAVRYRHAKRGISSAARKSAQPVSVAKPGTRSGRMSDSESSQEQASRVFRANPTLRNAARNLAARRAASRE